MKRTIVIFLGVLLTLGVAVCFLGFRHMVGSQPAMADTQVPAATQGNIPAPPAQEGATDGGGIMRTPTPTPAPIADDPAENARMAWAALFGYPSHEAPIRVLVLFSETDSPGEVRYRQMLAQGQLVAKGIYYALDAQDPQAWVQDALAAIPVGLLDSIYAETPQLAMAAYTALREAGRNDSTEVISAGITDQIISAMQEDPFAMGAAAGVYENERQVLYARDLREK